MADQARHVASEFRIGRLLALLTVVVTAAVAGTAPSNGHAAEYTRTVASVRDFDRLIASGKATMFSNPSAARRFGAAAAALAAQISDPKRRAIALATARWIEGEGAYRSNDAAAAGPLITDALKVIAGVAPGSKLHGDLLLSQAQLFRESGEPQNALRDLQKAYGLFVVLKDPRSQSKSLQSIGSIYQDARDYEKVLYYYQLADEISPNDVALSATANNNMANAYAELGRTDRAEGFYKRSLVLSRKLRSPLFTARIYSNIAEMAVINRRFADAQAALASGFRASTLPGASPIRPMLFGARAKLDLALGDSAAAVRDLRAAFDQSAAATDQSFKPIHLTAYHAYKAIGDPARALSHLETFQRMDIEGRALAASTNAALMAARFDFANQNARIAALKTGQLTRDIALGELRARQTNVIFSSLVALLTVTIIFLFFYLRSLRRNRNAIVTTNKRLAETNAELGSALMAKSEFLATTSHEIRTPLNGILGMTQVMLADRAIGGMMRERISLVDSAGRAMRTLVDDILDFAKIDSGEIRLDVRPVDLAAVVPELVALWRVQAADKGIDLQVRVAGVDRLLLTDVSRVRQILFNLLSNALKFTGHGAVAIDVQGDPAGRDETVTIAVRDTGIGIPQSAFETIFEPFRQLDAGTTRQFGGTGLGLAISRQLARKIGGDITVASIIGGGSTFTLCLPFPRAVADIARTGPPRGAADTARVLVASANPIRRSLLRTALAREFGFVATSDLDDPGAAAGRGGAIVIDVDDAATDVAAALAFMAAAVDGERTTTAVIVLVPARLAAEAPALQRAGAAVVREKPLRADDLAAEVRRFVDPAPAEPAPARVYATAVAMPAETP